MPHAKFDRFEPMHPDDWATRNMSAEEKAQYEHELRVAALKSRLSDLDDEIARLAEELAELQR